MYKRQEYAQLRSDAPPGECSADVRKRVIKAHQIQQRRAGKSNAHLDAKEVEEYCVLGERQHEWVAHALDKLNLSARAIHRTLKVARTVADLAAVDNITEVHLREALSYRSTLKEQYRPC